MKSYYISKAAEYERKAIHWWKKFDQYDAINKVSAAQWARRMHERAAFCTLEAIRYYALAEAATS